MKHFVMLLLALFSTLLLTAQTEELESNAIFSLTVGSSAGYINDVRGVQPEATMRLQLQDPEYLIRFEAGYRAQIVHEDLLKYQQFIGGGAVGQRVFDNTNFLLGMRYVHEKRDYDPSDEQTTPAIWVGDFEFWGGIEVCLLKRFEVMAYAAGAPDGNFHYGGKLSLRVDLFK